MDTEYTVLAVRQYSFNDDSTGRLIEGCKVFALSTEVQNGHDFKGREVLELPCEKHLWNAFTKVPSEYRLKLVPRSTSKGVKLTLTQATLVQK